MQKLFEKHHEVMRRRSEEGFDGFTLIELLIVIVVLGILAATVIFALGGVTSQSAQAACQSDAKSVETAIEAFHSFPGNTSNTYPTQISQLLTNGPFGQFLHAAPNNQHYTIGLIADSNGPTATATVGNGIVYVTNTGGPNSTTTGQNYDTESGTTGIASGCGGVQ